MPRCIFSDRDQRCGIGRLPPAAFNDPCVGGDGLTPGEGELYLMKSPLITFHRHLIGSASVDTQQTRGDCRNQGP